MDVVHPPPLSPGDRIAIVAPSMPIGEEPLEIALDRLREVFDLDPVVYDTARRDPEWLRAHSEERAADLEAAFRDPDIQGVMAATGGDDQLRVLKHLDREVLRENPTRFFGYSDTDNFRLFLWNLGIVSYGAVAMPTLAVDPEIHPYTEKHLRRTFFEERIGEIHPAEEWSDGWFDFDSREAREWHTNDGWQWWRGADDGSNADPETKTDADADPLGGGTVVEGRLWGGCYEIVSWQLQASKYLPDSRDLDGAVLVLEPSEELPYAADIGYTLRAMGERGMLGRFCGVLVGRPRAYSPEAKREVEFDVYREAIEKAVVTQLREYNPDAVAVFGLDFGHTDPRVPLPIGGEARIDPEEESITFV